MSLTIVNFHVIMGCDFSLYSPPKPFFSFYLPYLLASYVCCKPFVCHSYENCRGVYQQFPFWFTPREAERNSALRASGASKRSGQSVQLLTLPGISARKAKCFGKQDPENCQHEPRDRGARHDQQALGRRFLVRRNRFVHQLHHRTLARLINFRHLELLGQKLEDGLVVLHVAEFAHVIEARRGNTALGHQEVARGTARRGAHARHLALQARQLLLGQLKIRILFGGELVHGADLDLFRGNLAAQLRDGFDDGAGLSIELDQAGLLLGLLQGFFGVCQILLGLHKLLFEEQAPLGGLGDGDRCRKFLVFLNAYVEEYKKFSATIAVTEASQRRLFFEQQLVQAKEDLANAEEALKQTQQKTGLIQLDGQARAVIESVAQLRGQVAAKEVQIRAMHQFASEQNPDLQLAEQELAGLQSEVARMGAASGRSTGDFLMPKGSVPAAGLDYVRKLRDVKYNETIFELLAKQFEIAKIDEARQGSVVQLVDKAIPPDKKSSPKRLLIVACSAIAGFVLAIFWVLFSEALRFARRDPRQREQLNALARSFGRS